MFMMEYRDLGWWYWLATACLLTYALTANPEYFIFAIGLTLFQLVHFAIRDKSIKSFPVQVRFWYLILLLACLPSQLQILYWIPAIGTWAQIFSGYCAMARCVSLLPWNRRERFTIELLRKTFLSRPVQGSVLQGFAATK